MRRTRRLVGAVLAVGLVAACTGTDPGTRVPPASLDPASPAIAADELAFDREDLRVPADRPFVLAFENRESVPHNVAVYPDATREGALFQGEIFDGPATRWYRVPALAAGSYVFVCELHPSMTGRLVAA